MRSFSWCLVLAVCIVTGCESDEYQTTEEETEDFIDQVEVISADSFPDEVLHGWRHNGIVLTNDYVVLVGNGVVMTNENHVEPIHVESMQVESYSVSETAVHVSSDVEEGSIAVLDVPIDIGPGYSSQTSSVSGLDDDSVHIFVPPDIGDE